MAERIDITEKRIGPNRELVTPMDEFRGATFSVGTIISGAILSNNLDILSGGGRLYPVVASSVVELRPVNLEMWNQEAGWLEVEFRDGGWTGGRVLGPYYLQGRSRKGIPYEELKGRYFTSSIFAVVLSGWAAQPLSTGVKVNISYVKVPLDLLGL